MQKIGKYVIHKMAVTTGHARIFFCHDPDLQVPVAVKVFDPKAAEEGAMSPAQLMTRFLVEARALATFDHPYIVPIKALEHAEDGRPFFVMPFQAAHLSYEIGKDIFDPAAQNDLSERDMPRRMVLPRALTVLRHLSTALAVVHRRGMVHRAVKPSNILLTARENGVARLADFNMVRLPEKNPPLPDHWMGATEYYAPEQRENATGVDARADVYSLGVLAFRLVSGYLPETGGDGGLDLPNAPDALADLVRAAAEADPARRPAHAGAFLEALSKVSLDKPKGKVQVVKLRRPTARQSAGGVG